jgi:membrane-associated phospholipid phosphatase
MQLATSSIVPRRRCGSAKYTIVTIGKKIANWRELKSTAKCALFGLLMANQLSAQTDTTHVPSLFTYRDAILAGSFVIATVLVRPLDMRAAEALTDSSTQDSRRLHKLAAFVRTTTSPGGYIIGVSMYAIGRLTKEEHLQSMGLHGTEALIIGEAVGVAIKSTAGRQRPYVMPRNPQSYSLFRGVSSDEYRSFPSGHTVAAFAAAAATTGEATAWFPGAKWVVGPILYGGAAATGLSRMFDNRHWASDVVVGAAIGTFAGLKVVRYNGQHPNNGVDRLLITASIVPDGQDGHALHWSLAPARSPVVRGR